MTNKFDRKILWEERTGQKLYLGDLEGINTLACEPPQFQILLRDYLDVTANPLFKDFYEYARSRIMMDDVPDPLSCQAYLTRNPLLEKMANQLEALLGAWHPDETIQMEISQVKKQLKAALA